MTDVSMLGALLAGLVPFLSPCVLPLVPGYVSMLSGIGMEQLRQGQQPRAGLFGPSLSFVAGFSAVFITFGASASAVGQFLRQDRALLAPVAGALILLFGLHLIGWLAKLSFRVGVGIGIVLAALGFFAALQSGLLFAGFRAIHFFSLSIVGFLGPAMARWLNRDVHLRSNSTQPGVWSGFYLAWRLHLDGRRASVRFWRRSSLPRAAPWPVGFCCLLPIRRGSASPFCCPVSASAPSLASIMAYAVICMQCR